MQLQEREREKAKREERREGGGWSKREERREKREERREKREERREKREERREKREEKREERGEREGDGARERETETEMEMETETGMEKRERTSMKQQSYAMSEALVFLFGGLNALAQYRRIWTQVVVFPVPAVQKGSGAEVEVHTVCGAFCLRYLSSVQTLHRLKAKCMKDILGHETEFSDVRLEVPE